MFPALLITSDLRALYRRLSDQGVTIRTIYDQDDLRGFLLSYSQIVSERPIALSDISNLHQYVARLLKFVEDAKFPFIGIASVDNIPDILLSRFMSIVKIPNIIKNERDSLTYIKDKVLDEETPLTIEDIVRNAPSYLEFHSRIQIANLTSKKRIIQLMIGA